MSCASPSFSERGVTFPAGEFLFETLRVVVRDEGVDERTELAVHCFRQVMERQADAVIGDTILREIGGADFFGALAGCDLPAALLGDRGLPLILPLLREER